jgi:hypothetical protein
LSIDFTLIGSFQTGTVHLQDFFLRITSNEFKLMMVEFLKIHRKSVKDDKNLNEIGRRILGNPALLGKILLTTAIERLVLRSSSHC